MFFQFCHKKYIKIKKYDIILVGEKMKKENKKTQKEIKGKNKTNERVVQSKEENPIVTGSEIKNLLKIILIVTAIFLIFYGITTLVTDKKKEEENPNTSEAIIQYDEILLGTLFNQSNSEYYVLITTEEDQYASNYLGLISSYQAKENSKRVYTANLDNGFNKSYKAEETKISNNLKDLKLSGSTLLKIKNKNIVESYKNQAEITEYLYSLLK